MSSPPRCEPVCHGKARACIREATFGSSSPEAGNRRDFSRNRSTWFHAFLGELAWRPCAAHGSTSRPDAGAWLGGYGKTSPCRAAGLDQLRTFGPTVEGRGSSALRRRFAVCRARQDAACPAIGEARGFATGRDLPSVGRRKPLPHGPAGAARRAMACIRRAAQREGASTSSHALVGELGALSAWFGRFRPEPCVGRGGRNFDPSSYAPAHGSWGLNGSAMRLARVGWG